MSHSLVILVGAGAVIALVVFLAVWMMVPSTPLGSILEQRLASVPNAASYDIDLETGEFTQPAFERLVLPILSGFGNIIAKRTKEGQLQQLRKLVAKSGSRQRPETLLALRLILPIAGAAVCLGLAELLNLKPPENLLIIVVGVIGMYMYPTMSLERKAKKRQKDIQLALAGVMDLLTVCMEAGLSLDMAIMRVGESDESLLAREFRSCSTRSGWAGSAARP